MADDWPLRFDHEILERLQNAQWIQFYLIEPDAVSTKDSPSTYTCGYVYLKTDAGEFYRIQGYLTEDENGYDDVISIEIKSGWFMSAPRYVKRGASFIVADDGSEPLKGTPLLLYATLGVGKGLTVETRATTQVTIPVSTARDEVEFDYAIIFGDGERTVHITQHQGPYDILITMIPS